MKSIRCFAGAGLALVMAVLGASPSRAQTLGYISADLNNGIPTLASFNPSTGVIGSPFPAGLGGGQTFAVSSDGTTIYLPGVGGVPPNVTGVLNIVSAATGQILRSATLAHPATKVLLSGNGTRAYVLAEGGNSNASAVEVVDLATGKVTGALAIPGGGFRGVLDIALSPNDSQLFLALQCRDQVCPTFPTPCTVGKGICVFSALTLAFEWEVSELSGFLSISQDGNSLYVCPVYAEEGIYVLNTQTMAESFIATGGTPAGPPVVSPVGTYAIEFTNLVLPSVAEAYILDTHTNAIMRKLFPAFPGGSSATSEVQGFLGNQAIFASDGNSVWIDLLCYGGTGCTLPNGATQALAGFAFPSGNLIAETFLTSTPVPSLYDNVSLAFPHVLTAKQ